MKNKYYTILAALTLSALLLPSCKQQDMGTNNPYSQNVKSAIPYADSLELQAFTNDAQIVDYQLARKLALIQLHSSNKIENLKWENYKLSERPVIIYGFDNKPMYYDFFMCNANNTEKATITVNARKSASVIIKKYGNFVDSYQAITKGGGERLYADLSGIRYRAAGTKSGNVSSAVNINSGEVVNNLKQMSDDEIMSMMGTESRYITYLYMNWGWGGRDNAYYSANKWNPSLATNGGYEYDYRKFMVYNIKPR